MTEITHRLLTDERALYRTDDAEITDTIFDVGESPLKHCRNIRLSHSIFKGKYPLWYSENIAMRDCCIFEGGRAGIWYTNALTAKDCVIAAPKTIRRCRGITLENVTFPNAAETLWECSGITLRNVRANGDYLCMNSSDIEIDGLDLTGKYCFDGVKNVTVRNAKMIGRDVFWNSENITVSDSFISGDYIGWNTKNLTFINCTLESLQGFCYIENLVMKNCRLLNTTLAFEYSTVDLDIRGGIDSVINPSGGIIRADSIGELTLDPARVDVSRTQIITP